MTDVVDGLRLGFDFLCHCEEAKPTWQSVSLLAVIFRNVLPFPPGAYFFCLVQVGAKHLRCTLFAQTQAPAQPFRSLDSAAGGAPSWAKRSRQENDPQGAGFLQAALPLCTPSSCVESLSGLTVGQGASRPLPLPKTMSGGAFRRTATLGASTDQKYKPVAKRHLNSSFSIFHFSFFFLSRFLSD